MTEPRRELIVAAIGGNALLQRGQSLDIETQRANVAVAARSLADLARGVDLAVVHGNGPQVGLLAIESIAGPSPMPLDVLDAESQGQIGYLLTVELANALPDRRCVTLVTQVEVDPADPAFSHPTKPIGPGYEPAVARMLAEERRWTVAADGERWRRVVASPEPRRLLELDEIRILLAHHVVVVCGGGGGIPVIRASDGSWRGVEAVVDKDLTAALLAEQLGASALVLLTDVDAVYRGWGTPDAQPMRRIESGAIDQLGLPSGSMAPKVEAARRFSASTGRPSMIGALRDAGRLLRREVGTEVLGSEVLRGEVLGSEVTSCPAPVGDAPPA